MSILGVKTFVLEGIEIPLVAGNSFTDYQYSTRRSESLLPMADGSLRKQVYAGTIPKLSVSITSSGMAMPSGLLGLDLTQQLLLKCGALRSIASSSNAIAIPVNRRSDAGYEPKGYASVGLDKVETTILIADDVATLGVVPGATSYRVDYYPEVYVFAVLEENVDTQQAVFGWSLNCQEA